MTALQWPPRYGDEVLDYQVDWTEALDGDEIIDDVIATASAGSGLEVSEVSTSQGVTTLWIAGGGTIAALASVHLLATTLGGRKIAETVKIRIAAT